MESKPASCDCVVASNDVMLTYLLQVIVDRYYDSGDSIGAVFSSIEADSALVCACCAVNALPRYIINHNLLARWQLCRESSIANEHTTRRARLLWVLSK